MAATAIPVLIISGMTASAVLKDVFGSGCAGFMAKSDKVDQLADSVLVVARGGTVYSRDALQQRIRWQQSGRHETLTARELDVLGLLADGRSAQQISYELSVSLHTARNHVRSILTKLNAQSQLEAVVRAVQQGLVEISA